MKSKLAGRLHKKSSHGWAHDCGGRGEPQGNNSSLSAETVSEGKKFSTVTIESFLTSKIPWRPWDEAAVGAKKEITVNWTEKGSMDPGEGTVLEQ